MMMAKFAAFALFVLTLWLLSDTQAQPQCATLNLDSPLRSPAVGKFIHSETGVKGRPIIN